MRFLNLTLRNFKSVTKEVTLELDQGPGLYFMTGENRISPRLGANGVGKSSILIDGICWILYEKTARGLRAGDVCNWKAAKQAYGALILDAYGDEYVIERTWRPNSLTINGDPVENKDVEALVGLSYGMYLHSIAFGQFSPLFFDLRPQPKEALIADILKLNVWDERAKKASEKAKRADEQVRKWERRKAKRLGELNALREERDRLLERKTRWSKELEEKVERATVQLNADIKEIDDLNKEKNRLKAQIRRLGEHLEELVVDVRAWDRDIEDLRERREKIAVEYRVAEADVERCEALLDDLKRLEGHGACSLCGQTITGDHVAKEEVRVSRQRDDAAEECSQAAHNLKKLERAVREIRQNKEEVKSRTAETRADLASAERDLGRVVAEAKALARVHKEHQKEAEALEGLRFPYIGDLRDSKRAVAKARDSLDEVNLNLTESLNEHAWMLFWAKGFKRVRLYVMAQAIEQLELEVNNALGNLGLVGWSVRFDIERETRTGGTTKAGFHVFIKSPENDRPVAWEAWSGGETQRLRLAGSIGLSNLILARTGVSLPFEVWDEPSLYLSGEGIVDLLETLYDRAQREHKAVWLIDHRSLEYGGFADTYTVVLGKKGVTLQ